MLQRLWVKIRKGALGLARFLGPQPRAALDSGIGLWVLCLLMMIPAAIGVSLATWKDWHHSSTLQAQIPVRIQSWKTLKVSATADPVNFGDPSLPESQPLWTSHDVRGHSERERARVPASRNPVLLSEKAVGTTQWLAAQIDEQSLARAYFTQANVLYLGQIGGWYRVFLDGDSVTWGNAQGRDHVVTVPIPMKRLETGRPLSVAIEVSDPQQLGGKLGEGLVTPPMADLLVQERYREIQSRPMLFASIFGLMGLVFFLGWITHRRRQEYAVFAAFAFHQALIQVCAIDFVHSMMDADFWNAAEVSLLIWEASLGMLLGLSLARTRPKWIHVFVGITITVSLVPFASQQAGPWATRILSMLGVSQRYLFEWVVPLAFARGALACLIQWNLLTHKKVGITVPHRTRDLRRIGIGMALIGALYAFEGTRFSAADPAMSLLRLIHFGVLLFCYGWGAIQDRLQRQDLENAHVVKLWSDPIS